MYVKEELKMVEHISNNLQSIGTGVLFSVCTLVTIASLQRAASVQNNRLTMQREAVEI